MRRKWSFINKQRIDRRRPQKAFSLVLGLIKIISKGGGGVSAAVRERCVFIDDLKISRGRQRILINPYKIISHFSEAEANFFCLAFYALQNPSYDRIFDNVMSSYKEESLWSREPKERNDFILFVVRRLGNSIALSFLGASINLGLYTRPLSKAYTSRTCSAFELNAALLVKHNNSPIALARELIPVGMNEQNDKKLTAEVIVKESLEKIIPLAKEANLPVTASILRARVDIAENNIKNYRKAGTGKSLRYPAGKAAAYP